MCRVRRRGEEKQCIYVITTDNGRKIDDVGHVGTLYDDSKKAGEHEAQETLSEAPSDGNFQPSTRDDSSFLAKERETDQTEDSHVSAQTAGPHKNETDPQPLPNVPVSPMMEPLTSTPPELESEPRSSTDEFEQQSTQTRQPQDEVHKSDSPLQIPSNQDKEHIGDQASTVEDDPLSTSAESTLKTDSDENLTPSDDSRDDVPSDHLDPDSTTIASPVDAEGITDDRIDPESTEFAQPDIPVYAEEDAEEQSLQPQSQSDVVDEFQEPDSAETSSPAIHVHSEEQPVGPQSQTNVVDDCLDPDPTEVAPPAMPADAEEQTESVKPQSSRDVIDDRIDPSSTLIAPPVTPGDTAEQSAKPQSQSDIIDTQAAPPIPTPDPVPE